MGAEKKTKIFREDSIKDIVFIDGLTQCGKLMLIPVASSLERMELLQYRWLIESLATYHDLGVISKEMAVALLRSEAALLYYDMLVGRNINMRNDDISSIWRYKDPQKYFTRMISPPGDNVVCENNQLNPMMLFMTHDVMCHPTVAFEAFQHLKVVHIKRHPIDVVDCWLIKRGADRYKSPRSVIPLIQGPTEPMVWCAHGWEAEYESLPHIDRTIRMIDLMLSKVDQSMKALSEENKKKVQFVYFEEIISNPIPEIKKICTFLDTDVSSYTQIAVDKIYPLDGKREEKLKNIKSQASKKEFDLLMMHVERYEKEFYDYFGKPFK
jgi:hypothetical protein